MLPSTQAPQIEATYADIEARIGAKFIGRFDQTLNELIALLGAPPPDAEFEAATGVRRHLP